jgi:hypothetical protein
MLVIVKHNFVREVSHTSELAFFCDASRFLFSPILDCGYQIYNQSKHFSIMLRNEWCHARKKRVSEILSTVSGSRVEVASFGSILIQREPSPKNHTENQHGMANSKSSEYKINHTPAIVTAHTS